MKKSLFAALATLLVSSAYAQSNVTIYGLIDEGYKKDGGTHSSAGKINSGSTQQTRIGFKGTEDLGAGANANFTIELGLDPNANTIDAKTAVVRQGHVGIGNKDFGSLKIGKLQTESFYHFGELGAFGGSDLPGSVGYFRDKRHDRGTGVQYQLSGQNFGLTATYFGGQNFEHADSLITTKDPLAATQKGYELGGKATFGAFSTGAEYRRFGQLSFGAQAQTILAHADYDFGVAKVTYAFLDQRNINVKTTVETNTIHAPGIATQLHQVGFKIPVTPAVEVIGTGIYGKGSVNHIHNESAYDAVIGDRKSIIKGYQTGIKYNLSKRTSIYGIYGENIASSDLKTGAGKVRDNSYALGLKHTF